LKSKAIGSQDTVNPMMEFSCFKMIKLTTKMAAKMTAKMAVEMVVFLVGYVDAPSYYFALQATLCTTGWRVELIAGAYE
jgi:hypothetical protein